MATEPPAPLSHLRSTDPVDDDEAMTPEEVDAEFEATQPIGDMIHVLAQAEAIVAAVDLDR